MEIKVCGMREPENIRELIKVIQPDWMGLIFYPKSPRFVSLENQAWISSLEVKKVGVFVNENEEEILRKIQDFKLSAVQLHGQESPDFVKSLASKTEVELWKVVSVKEEIEWDRLKEYESLVDKFLFDTASVSHGGTGRRFDWTYLKTYPFNKGFLLGGGLEEGIEEEILALAAEIPTLIGVDLNSKFEVAPGLKNIEKLKRFKENIRP
ncbi:phosphoribosylanthranilate isomerase [Algoriphagus boseongensis]|uniref:N-(5'-phosphoribosyl)anthranilate isomerase n=1 Tax=Algoriphagus boseongensis TaxID=1442587 RepID=A0A4R6T3F9_9BACT|nr:phosphoribosylanthranilate isomerase [Algoriphagus boseongensis]TDQ15243.1 phosphoribosylanthranilate isomerase [Algoriphagus boseongensis]